MCTMAHCLCTHTRFWANEGWVAFVSPSLSRKTYASGSRGEHLAKLRSRCRRFALTEGFVGICIVSIPSHTRVLDSPVDFEYVPSFSHPPFRRYPCFVVLCCLATSPVCTFASAGLSSARLRGLAVRMGRPWWPWPCKASEASVF
ncbi:hypothetical protein C8Q78DRAFT_285694 [Trametes maxima]|nr:hypothetical protein C8Q78DRAFT_285694 [Trametes maxima]